MAPSGMIVRLTVDGRTLYWVDAKQWLDDILFIGGQTIVGMLPWIAMAFAGGKFQSPPPHTLRAFGGGSGLLAFFFSPASSRCSFGEPDLVSTPTPAVPVDDDNAGDGSLAPAALFLAALFPR